METKTAYSCYVETHPGDRHLLHSGKAEPSVGHLGRVATATVCYFRKEQFILDASDVRQTRARQSWTISHEEPAYKPRMRISRDHREQLQRRNHVHFT